MKRRTIGLLLGALVLAGVGGWSAQRLSRGRTLVAEHIPPAPTTGSRSDLLVENLTAAETRAHSWLHARAGLVALSQLYHANGFFAEALNCYEGLRVLEPGNPRWPHLEAGLMAGFGRVDEALPLRETAVKLAPDYIPARLRLGDMLVKTNRTAEAAQAYGEVLRRVPDEPYALLGLARCDLARRDWTAAREKLQRAIVQHPDFIGALSLLVTVSEQLGDQAAADSYRTAMGSNIFIDLPDPWLDELSDVCFDAYLLSVAASTANYAGNRANALALIDRAIALSSDASSYRRQAAKFMIQDRNFTGAKNQLEQVLAANPTDSDSWLQYLEALRGLGDQAAVATAIFKGLAAAPQSSGLHLEHARWLKSSGRLDEAIREFSYAYQLRPTEAQPLIELAATYLALGRNSEAIQSLNQALERQPDHPLALATLAIIAIGTNDEPEAQRRWTQLRRQPKTPPEMMLRVQQAYQQQFGRRLP